LAKPAETTD